MMTYESASEAEVLKSLWRPGVPLENTLFAILDPSGRALTRGVRSPDFIFNDAHDMAAGLDGIARRYQGRGNPQSLPSIATVRLGLNVAACDKRPLAIVVADTEQERRGLEARLAPLAWSQDFMGKVTYTSGSSRSLRDIKGAHLYNGYLLVSPNEFGTEGTVLAQVPPSASPLEIKRALSLAVESYQAPPTDHRQHVLMGKQLGIHWTTAIPVTDQGALRAERPGPLSGGPGGGGFGPRFGGPGPQYGGPGY